jgi:hypothetical protein
MGCFWEQSSGFEIHFIPGAIELFQFNLPSWNSAASALIGKLVIPLSQINS